MSIQFKKLYFDFVDVNRQQHNMLPKILLMKYTLKVYDVAKNSIVSQAS